MKYSSFGNAGTATTTAASAGINDIYQPSAAPMGSPVIYEWSVGPQSTSADKIYGVRLKRVSGTGPTFTAVTPSPLDTPGGVNPVALTIAGVAQTVAHGSAGVELARFGFHMRGGYRWVAVPGGEMLVKLATSNGILLEYVFTDGTDTLGSTIFFSE